MSTRLLVLLTLAALAHVPRVLSADKPTLSSVSPATGDNHGGTPVTLHGAGFMDTVELTVKECRYNFNQQTSQCKTTQGYFVSTTQISYTSSGWTDTPCSQCSSKTCPTDTTEPCLKGIEVVDSHADLSHDGRNLAQGIAGRPHYLADENHHADAGIMGQRGLDPGPKLANEYHPTLNPGGNHPIGYKRDSPLSPAGTADQFYGHTGSPYLVANSKYVVNQIFPGSVIKFRSQYFTVVRIEVCEGMGCWCQGGTWSSNQLVTNNTITGACGDGATDKENITCYGVGPYAQSLGNNALYEYKKNSAYWDGYNPPTCNGGSWEEGVQITLDQPVYHIQGKPFEEFTTEVYIANAAPDVDCRGKGCQVTVTVSNDGKQFSGSGINGQCWSGNCAKFTYKHVVPLVQSISILSENGYELGGVKDSTRLFTSAAAGGRIRVHGKDFLPGPNLRCYFDTLRIMTPAVWISEFIVECKVPQNFARPSDKGLTTTNDNVCPYDTAVQYAQDITSEGAINPHYAARLYDNHCTDSQQTGSAVVVMDGAETSYSYSHVQVTNNGLLEDASIAVSRRPDGAFHYIEEEDSPSRSTCTQFEYPHDQQDQAVRPGHEMQAPCRGAHRSADENALFAEGNDVQIKFGTCHEAQTAKSTGTYLGNAGNSANGDYYLTDADLAVTPDANTSYYSRFRIDGYMAGPLQAVDLHLIKEKAAAPTASCYDTTTCEAPARQETRLEVCISAGGPAGGHERVSSYATGYRAAPTGNTSRAAEIPTSAQWQKLTSGHILSCEEISVMSIKNTSSVYTVYFKKAPYLLAYYTLASGGDCSGSTCSTFYGGSSKDGGDSRAHFTNKDYSSDTLYSNEFSAEYFITVSYISGPATVSVATSEQSSKSHVSGEYGGQFDWQTNISSPLPGNRGLRMKFFTCDGCRWKYVSQVSSGDPQQIGKIFGRQTKAETMLATFQQGGSSICTSNNLNQRPLPYPDDSPDHVQVADPSGVLGIECGQQTFREQLAQAFRPMENGNVAKIKLRLKPAYNGSATDIHDDRTKSGDFVSAIGSSVSVLVTKYGKLDEYVCQEFSGTYSTSETGFLTGQDKTGCGPNDVYCKHCDIDNDGVYKEMCDLGYRCNFTLTEYNGGCGSTGKCAKAEILDGSNHFRPLPAGNGPAIHKCGEEHDCDNELPIPKAAGFVRIPQAVSDTDWQDVTFEFVHPLNVEKHTTYYINAFIDDTIMDSDSVEWYGGRPSANDPKREPMEFSRHAFLGAYKRANLVNSESNLMTFTWTQIPDYVFYTEIFRCVTGVAQIHSYSTVGEAPSGCTARSSPNGAIQGALITFKGQNLYAGTALAVNFLTADGLMGVTQKCTSTRYDATEMTCLAPSYNPDEGKDCTIEGNCQGVEVVATNDGYNWGSKHMMIKHQAPYMHSDASKSPTQTSDAAVPAVINASHHDNDYFVQRQGVSNDRFCFENIYVDVTGSDIYGTGRASRPFGTIQKAVDAANEYDTIILLPGRYTGSGNRGIQHQNKKIIIIAFERGTETVIDCEGHADGFILNNNKDSSSVAAGYIDLEGVKTTGCENLRVYF